MNQNEFDDPIEVMFDEWQSNWKLIKIVLYKFQTAQNFVYDKTPYWVFEGKVESRNNELRIENGVKCRFYFSKRIFKKEIQRHLCLHTLDWDTLFDVSMEIKRPSKYRLVMQNVEIKFSS